MAAASHHRRLQQSLTERLHLRHNSDLGGLVATLRASSDRLHHVHVECNDYLDHPGWHSNDIRGLFETIGTLPHLRSVSLQNLGAGVFGFPLQLLSVLLERTQQQHHRLEHNAEFVLNMEALNLLGDPEDMEELAQAIRNHTSLRCFRLELSGFTYDTLSAGVTLGPMIEALAAAPSVEEMVIGNGDFVYYGQIESQALATIRQSTSLRCCDLYGFRFSTEHLVSISNSLQTNTHVEELCLDACTLDQEGVLALSQLIRANHALKKVDLQVARRAYLSPPSLLEIASALGENSTLQQLHLPLHEEIDEQTDAIFVAAVEANCSLESLELTTSGTMSPTIMFYLQLNRRGRGRLLQNVETITTNEYVEALADVGGELSCIFYFLRSYPLLCHPPGAGMSVRQHAKRKRVA